LPRSQPDGNTAFYDACYIGLDKVQHGRYAKRALLLVSDGLNNYSRYSFKDVREVLRQANVILYSLAIFNEASAGSSLGMEGAGILEEFSFTSGGVTVSMPDTIRAFELIANDLRNQYSIAVAPNNRVANKTWHKIKVKVSRSAEVSPDLRNLTVRTRQGYYSF
jgi:Ca-activated chloride channel family protein